MVCKSLVDKKLAIPTKLLVCLVTNNFDNFDGQMEKVGFQVIWKNIMFTSCRI